MPDAPTLVGATRGDALVDLSWTAPAENGGFAITSYQIFRAACSGCAPAAVITTGSNGTSFGDTNLTNGATYYYQVAATNSLGTGAKSNERNATPATVPGAPALQSATPGALYVDLAWAPSSTGGSAITGYNVYRATCSGCQAEPPVATGLQGNTWRDAGVAMGTTYHYKVAAVNALGAGAKSNERSATTPTVPGAPTLTGASRGNGYVDISWTAPASNGGSAVTGYKVYRATCAGCEADPPVATGVTGSTYRSGGLTNGVMYYFTVAAVNALGTGPQSNERSATPATTPGVPTLTSATAGPGYVDLAWTTPSNGGTAITGYNLFRGTCSNCQGSTPYAYGVAGTSYRDSGVTNGVTYYYKVVAINAVGFSGQSNERSATPATTPGAPTLNSATAGVGYVDLAWSAPSSNGGSTVTSYSVYRSTCAGCQGSAVATGLTGTTWRDLGATPGSTFCYRVAAANAIGVGTQSNERCATSIASVPNDHIANAFVGSGTSWTPAAQNTQGATSQTNELYPCGMAPSTVWYRFTPTSGGRYRISTSGATYDTVVAVYASATLGSPQMGCNDDAPAGTWSQLDVDLAANAPYWIQIGSFSSAYGGTLPLSIQQTAILVRDDDGTMEASLDFDFTDDTATKSLVVASSDLLRATSATLWVYAQGQNCGVVGGTQTLKVNGIAVSTSYNPCTRWPTGSFGWASFAVSTTSLLAGANTVQILDVGGSFSDRGAFFGIDTQRDYARSTIRSNGGVDQTGELMWYLSLGT